MSCDSTMVKVGSVIIDNDPRMNGRKLRVLSFGWVVMGPTYVVCKTMISQRTSRIKLETIHTDGKPRKRGFSLVPHDEQTP